MPVAVQSSQWLAIGSALARAAERKPLVTDALAVVNAPQSSQS